MRETGSRATRRAMRRPKLLTSSGPSGRSGRANTCAADRPRAADIRRRASLPGPSMPAVAKSAVARRSASASVNAWAAAASGIADLVHGRQFARLMLCYQSIYQLVERGAFQYFIELVQRQADAMVGDAPLWEIVGADALRAIARANLALALRGARLGRLHALKLIETRAQHLHGKPAVLVLRLLGRNNDKASWQMRDAYGGICLVDVLATGTACPHGVDAQVLGADVEIDVLHFRKHSHRRCRGMNAPARFRGGHALHAMHARFVLEARKHPLAGNRSHDLLVAAKRVFRQADDVRLPAAFLRVAAVHAKEVGREQRGLVTPGAGPHLQDGALFIGRILGQQLHAQLVLELAHARLERGQLLLRHRRQLRVCRRVGEELGEVGALGLGLAQILDGGNERVELGKLFGKLHVTRLVQAAAQLRLDGGPALDQLLEFLGGDGTHEQGYGGGRREPTTQRPDE